MSERSWTGMPPGTHRVVPTHPAGVRGWSYPLPSAASFSAPMGASEPVWRLAAMSDLTEFLLARIDDDLMDVGSLECPCDLSHDGTHAAFCPVRVLADVAAKRRIVEAWADADPSLQALSGLTLEWAMCTLATVYADHPDYREEWRP